jgi:hypothetical protein
MPFQFDTNGFLTKGVAELETEIRECHEELFHIASEINRACHEAG